MAKLVMTCIVQRFNKCIEILLAKKVKIDPLLLFKEERTRIPKTFWLDMDFNNDEIFIY